MNVKEQVLCPVCKEKDKEITMVEEHDMLTCPECQTSFILEDESSSFERYMDDWKKNAEEIFPLLRPPLRQIDLPNPRLFFLYEDCYHTLLIGRYNAAIVLMGVLLEAIMKERIELKLGIDFRKPYGACLKKIEEERLMDVEDIYFLRKFKDNIRNPYQHSDEYEILKGHFVYCCPLEFEGELSFEGMLKAIEKIKSGQLKPKLLPAVTPELRSIVKQGYDRKQAIDLFNQVYDFLLVAQVKYFKQEEYDEHNRKFGTELKDIEHYKI